MISGLSKGTQQKMEAEDSAQRKMAMTNTPIARNLVLVGQTLRARDLDRKIPKLTPEQIAHWRDFLLAQVGPFALMLSDAEIELIRDAMQDRWVD